MNWGQIEGNWKQFEGHAQEKWGKLTEQSTPESLATGYRQPIPR
jgi:uncharacterized protein YjbJ (UPF0337 family)